MVVKTLMDLLGDVERFAEVAQKVNRGRLATALSEVSEEAEYREAYRNIKEFEDDLMDEVGEEHIEGNENLARFAAQNTLESYLKGGLSDGKEESN